ncbi:hypothetical protein B0T26DRAFT_792277 [Lasiosphaeria miniovina]|uniref:Uncharacterized protein n=1 Tax=Lasiosphaeria miniovina TaxID=1954250 RepID=A0AA39ZT92_9PEZI|nr:uncharacterized protein B0T26DRAFT_792277 [Lasiosphaeria miniovina]KAK0703244.1 hypothetical protein B0T26DRAFT_792277 [Lasiosphaeria miniovina]
MALSPASAFLAPPEELAVLTATPSKALLRLMWGLQGTRMRAIQVADDPADPLSPCVPYYNDPWSARCHPISYEPATVPAITTITVHEMTLKRWKQSWLEFHDNHDGVMASDAQMSQLTTEFPYNHLIQCCGTDRPPAVQGITVHASGRYLSVGDYVNTVYPWLMSMRPQILAAIYETQRYPVSSGSMSLQIDQFSPAFLMVYLSLSDDPTESYEVRSSISRSVGILLTNIA